MKIAIDVDGTLSRDTKQLKKLMQVINLAENTVVILTGSLNNFPTREQRIEQLVQLGVTEEMYSELVICNGGSMQEVAEQKGAYCFNNQIDMVFEDDDNYISKINELSPETSTWLIRRWI